MTITDILDRCDRNIPVRRAHDGAGQHDAAIWAVAMKTPSGWQPLKFFSAQDQALIEAARLDGQGIEARVGNTKTKEIVWQSR